MVDNMNANQADIDFQSWSPRAIGEVIQHDDWVNDPWDGWTLAMNSDEARSLVGMTVTKENTFYQS